MCFSTRSEEQALLVAPLEGLEHLDPKDLRKITPAMARAVEDSAKEIPVHVIAEREQVSVHCIHKRLGAVRKLLKVYTTLGAYRLLLLAGIIVLK